MDVWDRCYNIADLRAAAKRRLPKWVFDYIDLGVEDFVALERNLDVYRRVKLLTRVLADMRAMDLSIDLLGGKAALPMVIGPTGSAGMCWYEGECEMARAAARFGIPYTMTVGSLTKLERVATAGGRLWLQLYIWENREFNYELVERGRNLGYEALIVTADYGVGNNREYNIRNGYVNPIRPSYPIVRDILLRPDWMVRVLFKYWSRGGMPRQANNPAAVKDMDTRQLMGTNGAGRWEDIGRFRERWPHKLIVKGILSPEDAERAVGLGADAIVVSNHGGRGLDSAITSIEAMQAIAQAVGGKTTILLDSGIRRGSDIVKAQALGAKAVLLGRAALWGNAVGGEAGTIRALELLKREYRQTLGMVGRSRADAVDRSVIAGEVPAIGYLE